MRENLLKSMLVGITMLSSSVAMAQTAVSNIAGLSEIADGTEVTLTLSDAQISVFQKAGAFTIVQDATGAVQIDSEMVSDIFYAVGNPSVGSVIAGTLTASYSDANGVPTLSISDNTGTSTDLSITDGDAPTAPEVTVDEANTEANILKVVKLSNVEVANIFYNSEDGSTTFTIGAQPNTITGNDIFNMFATDEGTSMTNGTYDITGIVYPVDGELQVYPIEMTLLRSAKLTIDNIAALSDVEDGTEVYLTLTDAKITVYKNYGMFTVLEDATGSVMVDGNLAMSVLGELGDIAAGSVLNGTLVAAYSTENGIPTLSISTNTGNGSSLTMTEGDAPVPAEVTVDEANSEENLLKLVKLSEVEVSNVYYNESTWKTTFLIGNLSSSIAGADVFGLFDTEEGTSLENGTYNITGVVYAADGELVIYPIEMTAISSGINAVKASDAAAKTIYNLNGQRVSKASKGLYIVNGKKVVLK